VIIADLATLKVLIQSYYPLISTFGDPFKGILEGRQIGSHVVRFPPGDLSGDATLSHEVVLPIWKSNVSLTLMMDKKAKSALSLRLFGTDISTAGREGAQKPGGSGSGTPLKAEEETVMQENDVLELTADV